MSASVATFYSGANMNKLIYLKRGIVVALLGMVAGQALAGDWAYHDIGGRDEKLCQIMRKRLNQLARDKTSNYNPSWDAMMTYPKLSTPPWEDLDPKEHEALVLKLLKYAKEGVAGYFQTMTGLPAYPDSVYKNELERLKKVGFKLQVWRTRLTGYYDYKPAPAGKQTVVQILRKLHNPSAKKRFPNTPIIDWQGDTFIVTPDLKGPDPAVDEATASTLWFNHLMIFEGQPIGITTDEIYKDQFNAGFNNTYCSFEFIAEKK
jgi:hypothetical protein